MIEQLYRIFEHQRDLMERLAPKELENGYLAPTPPLDLQLREHQQHFRLMAWFFTEEVVESLLASDEEHAEELSDVLHFLTELCILADVSPESVAAVLIATDSRPDVLDVLIQVGKAANRMKAKPWKSNPQPTDEEAVQRCLRTALAYLWKYIQAEGHDPHEIYFHKNEINKKRIQSGY